MSGTDTLDAPHFIEAPHLPLDGKVFLLLTAAGSSSRFGSGKKELLSLDGKSILQLSLEAFLHLDELAGIIVTYPKGRLDDVAAGIDPSLAGELGRLPYGLRFAQGGDTRQASVKSGLDALMEACHAASPGTTIDPDRAVVLVHDAARPWASPELIDAVLSSTCVHGACIPLADLADTPKAASPTGFIDGHLERHAIKAAQTPQGFALGALAAAHAAAAAKGWFCTDDASIWDRYVGKVAFVPGDRNNRKVTYREDLPAEAETSGFRIGEGWDIHPLVPGRRLLLGGVHVEHDKGEAGHSDGDVLWHALIDALLGAAALGDIGSHFPPSDHRWKDADSGRLAQLAMDEVEKSGWRVGNIDCTVILEKPRLSPYREAMCASIAKTLGLPQSSISIKAKTCEGFGDVGSGNAVEARAVVLLVRRR
ncbi:MAG: 2-C-methyl-D-erythritol 2,4-cyclodiphosphate synthase [Spirochaetae bacterium HGW-Spirochaetae-9]|nr:MAG: 2-C-methyl-D-erythritol 2,4-cyclodiphosphate synthase [Spirochaetae bacterium HGW-Spirochaetae-9]